jgi:hypothetical protein
VPPGITSFRQQLARKLATKERKMLLFCLLQLQAMSRLSHHQTAACRTLPCPNPAARNPPPCFMLLQPGSTPVAWCTHLQGPRHVQVHGTRQHLPQQQLQQLAVAVQLGCHTCVQRRLQQSRRTAVA